MIPKPLALTAVLRVLPMYIPLRAKKPTNIGLIYMHLYPAVGFDLLHITVWYQG